MTMRKRMTTVIAILLVAIILCGMTAAGQSFVDHTAPDNGGSNMLDCATLIDDENRKLIGKEVQDDTPLVAVNSKLEQPDVEKGSLDVTEVNRVVDSFDDDVVQPVNLTNFETIDDVTPEVIIPNGSAAIFGKHSNEGWMCNIGDELVYQFEKYPSEVVDQQTLVVGYILNGVMYPGEKYLDMEGEYRHTVKENGEYFIYVINAASDNLALESGGIYILESEENK